jgi:hypothetical protein
MVEPYPSPSPCARVSTSGCPGIITHASFIGCFSPGNGGAIAISNCGKVHISDCQFGKCQTYSGSGGAIWLSMPVASVNEIIRCKFWDCISDEGVFAYLEKSSGPRKPLPDLNWSDNTCVDGSSNYYAFHTLYFSSSQVLKCAHGNVTGCTADRAVFTFDYCTIDKCEF